MDVRLLLVTDLDRTAIPNGDAPESERARPLFRVLAGRPDVVLAYCSGRDPGRIREAIETWDLPVPDFAIGDVGTSMHGIERGRWRPLDAWHDALASSWSGRSHADVADVVREDVAADRLVLQEPDRQGRFKVSFYAPATFARDGAVERLRARLERAKIAAHVVWSVDDEAGRGLLDVLPASASKLHAARFLRERLDVPLERTMFAGDSGNDLDPLASEIPAVLVANAREEVRREAITRSEAAGTLDRLWIARGGFLSMNGCYAAGILEGVARFAPDALTS